MIRIILVFLGIGLLLITLVLGGRALRLAWSVGSYRKFWTQQAAIVPRPDDFIYVALGDSTAQAIGASQPMNGYVGLVASHLKQKTGRGVHIINLSVSGATIQDVLDNQLPQLKTIPKIDLITIEIGANDVPKYNVSDFSDKFKRLVSQLPSGTLISDIPSFKGGLKGNLRDTSKAAAEEASKLIKQRDDLSKVDIFEVTDAAGRDTLAADFFHPNDKGYQNWSRAFIRALSASLR